QLKLRITVGGRPYEIAMGEFSALDEVHYKKATGEDMMSAFTGGNINTILLAGLVWLHRRRYEKTLRFETVAAEFKWNDLSSMEFLDDEDAPQEPLTLETFSDPEG